MLNRKNITRLLNPAKRRLALDLFTADKRREMKSAEYARYVVDGQILHRDASLACDKKSFYGFQPINFLCAVTKDGAVKSKLFEFNIVNHFLHMEEGENACEAVEAILLMWKKEDKTISSFDPDVIDRYLSEVEKSYAKEKQSDENA